MAVTAQTGVFSFGPQAAKGSISTTFYKHYASDVDLSAISDDRTGPPEVVAALQHRLYPIVLALWQLGEH